MAKREANLRIVRPGPKMGHKIRFADRQPYSEHDGRESTEFKTDGTSEIAYRRSWRDFFYGLGQCGERIVLMILGVAHYLHRRLGGVRRIKTRREPAPAATSVRIKCR